MSVARCFICRGSILNGVCLMCGRSPEPERVSLGEALISNTGPLYSATDDMTHYETPRQRIPIEVSLARAEAWLKGERA